MIGIDCPLCGTPVRILRRDTDGASPRHETFNIEGHDRSIKAREGSDPWTGDPLFTDWHMRCPLSGRTVQRGR